VLEPHFEKLTQHLHMEGRQAILPCSCRSYPPLAHIRDWDDTLINGDDHDQHPGWSRHDCVLGREGQAAGWLSAFDNMR
jgi:hypothetical protein